MEELGSRWRGWVLYRMTGLWLDGLDSGWRNWALDEGNWSLGKITASRWSTGYLKDTDTTLDEVMKI